VKNSNVGTNNVLKRCITMTSSERDVINNTSRGGMMMVRIVFLISFVCKTTCTRVLFVFSLIIREVSSISTNNVDGAFITIPSSAERIITIHYVLLSFLYCGCIIQQSYCILFFPSYQTLVTLDFSRFLMEIISYARKCHFPHREINR